MPAPTALDATLHFGNMKAALENAARAGHPTDEHWRLAIAAYLLLEATMLGLEIRARAEDRK
jgi:hypothetical protein